MKTLSAAAGNAKMFFVSDVFMELIAINDLVDSYFTRVQVIVLQVIFIVSS